MSVSRLGLVSSLVLSASVASASNRVIALSPHLAELVCAAGACDRLVGVVAHTDFPQQAARLPQVGDAFAVNAEALVALKPDLVLSWSGGTARGVTERLRTLKLPVQGIAVSRLDDIAGALRQLGALLGTMPAAERAASAFEQRLRRLRAQYAADTRLRVLYSIELEPMYTVNRDSPISEAIALCGGDNVFADLAPLSAAVGKEPVLASRPEVVVFAREDGETAVRAWWARWPQVPAVKNGALYAMDGNLLTRATPRMLDGVEQLCAAFSDARAKYFPR